MLSRFSNFTRRYAILLKWGGALLAGVAVVLILRALPLQPALEWLSGQVESLGPYGPIAFVTAFMILTPLLLPGWPLNVLAGILFGPIWGGVWTSVGSTLAAGVPFLISRYLVRDWFVRTLRRYPRIEAVYRALGAEANWKVVAAVRLSHALPFGLQNYLLGITPVRLVPFLFTTWAVTLPGIFMIAYLAHLGISAVHPAGDEVPSLWMWIGRGVGLIVAAGAIYYIGRVVRRALNEHGAPLLEDDDPAEPPQSASWQRELDEQGQVI